MEFALTEEQQMIRDTAESFLTDKSSSEAIRAAMATELGYDRELWTSVCDEMYWHAMHIPEEYGGLGLGYVEVAVVMEQMGRRLLCSPFFATVGLAVNALLQAGDSAQKTEWLAKITEGQTATLAYSSGGRDCGLNAVNAEFAEADDGVVLNGDYHYVVDGHSADILIVAARNHSDNEQIELFVLHADTEGVTREWTPTMDQTRKLGKLSFANVKLPTANRLAHQSTESGRQALRNVLDLGLIALAAEQSGGAQAILEQAVAYTLEREQFGRSIASFQSIKHKAADMKLKAEVSRSAVYYAACVAQESLAGDEGDSQFASELAEASSMAKAYCSDAYFYNAGNGLQMFGGVGFTWEYDVHLYFKRAKSSETLLGDGTWHRERIASLLLDSNPESGAAL